jgi:hypothetical protein
MFERLHHPRIAHVLSALDGIRTQVRMDGHAIKHPGRKIKFAVLAPCRCWISLPANCLPMRIGKPMKVFSVAMLLT